MDWCCINDNFTACQYFSNVYKKFSEFELVLLIRKHRILITHSSHNPADYSQNKRIPSRFLAAFSNRIELPSLPSQRNMGKCPNPPGMPSIWLMKYNSAIIANHLHSIEYSFRKHAPTYRATCAAKIYSSRLQYQHAVVDPIFIWISISLQCPMVGCAIGKVGIAIEIWSRDGTDGRLHIPSIPLHRVEK